MKAITETLNFGDIWGTPNFGDIILILFSPWLLALVFAF